MDDIDIEVIITRSIRLGTIQTLKSLGKLEEVISMNQAESTYGERQIKQWRDKGWITGYPTHNGKRGKVYFKFSELERASCMLDIQNAIPANRISKIVMNENG